VLEPLIQSDCYLLQPIVAQIDVFKNIWWFHGVASLDLPEITIGKDEKTQIII
jgi:hypothetical protein